MSEMARVGRHVSLPEAVAAVNRRAVNNRHEKASSMTAREILKEMESGKCSPNFLSEEQFEKWKAEVLAGKFDRKR